MQKLSISARQSSCELDRSKQSFSPLLGGAFLCGRGRAAAGLDRRQVDSVALQAGLRFRLGPLRLLVLQIRDSICTQHLSQCQNPEQTRLCLDCPPGGWRGL